MLALLGLIHPEMRLTLPEGPSWASILLGPNMDFGPWPQHLPEVASELSNGASILTNNTLTFSAIILLPGN